MVIAVAVLIVGGIYHTKVAQYFADHSAGSSHSGGATSVVGSVQGMGNSSNALMTGVGNTLNR
jgi:hypothetical protein